MNKSYLLYCTLFVIFLLTSCGKPKGSSENELVTIDRNLKAPEKELIIEDLGEVSYIPMETTDSSLMDENSALTITRDYILEYQYKTSNLNVFNCQGKYLTSINHRGGGINEYNFLSMKTQSYDSSNIVLFTSKDYRSLDLMEYTSDDLFVRKVELGDSLSFRFSDIVFYNKDYLLLYEKPNGDLIFSGDNDKIKKEAPKDPFLLLNAKTGQVEKRLPIYFDNRFSQYEVDKSDNYIRAFTYAYDFIRELKDEFLLNEFSADTLYSLSRTDMKVKPIVALTPSTKASEKPIVAQVDWRNKKYLFFTLVNSDRKASDGFKSHHHIYDYSDGSFSEIMRFKTRYASPKLFEKVWVKSFKDGFYFKIGVDILMDELDAGTLSGPLKEIAEQLDEDSNPVLIVLKIK